MESTAPEVDKALSALESVIKKSRVHLYKPIQIAEILYRDRVKRDIDLGDLETYRKKSKAWRDKVTKLLTGNVSTSSAKFQDNLFESNAIPPKFLVVLGEENRRTDGGVEKKIYKRFKERFTDIEDVASYANKSKPENFSLLTFLTHIEERPGLKRSIDKIYEIVVYSLFETLIDEMDININISVNNPNSPIFSEFADFSEKVFNNEFPHSHPEKSAKLFRVGVANAADRGLDMWGNFGLAIQIKHLTISEEMAENIVESVNADRIVIVCKDAEERIILSLINQLGWKGRVQSVITLNELEKWYTRAMCGKLSHILGSKILERLVEQITLEFPMTSGSEKIQSFFEDRGYLDF
tara:strand:+ start:1597 stop:2655 length:1059 start_codon:yes stop_codon:yes gene_type:complete